VGAAFAFLGSLGLARFPDFYMRLHGPSKATTLGIGGVLAGSLVWFASRGALTFHELLITAFVALTTPVSGHFLARAARHRRVREWRNEARDGGAAESRDAPGERTESR
jgi:multicomponent K+:H+ antiporter subunit G